MKKQDPTNVSKGKDQYLENSRDRFEQTLEILKKDIERIISPVIRDIGGYKYLTEIIIFHVRYNARAMLPIAVIDSTYHCTIIYLYYNDSSRNPNYA